MKYKLNATVTVTLEEVTVKLDSAPSEELDFQDALLQQLGDRLVYLDAMGGRTGADGCVTALECESIDDWDRQS